MGLLGHGVLAIWNGVAPGGDVEFNEWHTREHMPERLSIPGFLRGRRYTAVVGTPRYFTLYETADVSTLASAAYLDRLNNPTTWTRRCLPLFRDTKRGACRVSATVGTGIGGFVATLELGPAPGHDEELRAWLIGTTLLPLHQRPGIAGAHVCEPDIDASSVKTEEKKLRDQPDAAARWVVLVEGVDPALVEDACRELTRVQRPTLHGAIDEPLLAVYALSYCLGASDTDRPTGARRL